MLVALRELLVLRGRALHVLIRHAILRDDGLHRHQDVFEFVVVDEYAGGIGERLAAHRSRDHRDRDISRTLERRTAAQVDDVLAALNHPLLQVGPVALGHLFADQLRKGPSGDERRRGEDRHLLAVAAVGAAVADFVGPAPNAGAWSPAPRGSRPARVSAPHRSA